MPDFLTDAVAAAFEPITETPAAQETPASPPAPADPIEGDAPAADEIVATADSTDSAPDPAPAPTPATPVIPDAAAGNPAVSVEDLQAIKDRFAADHPELVPVMDAFLKESGRGLNRKFEQLAALKKEAAEQVVRDSRLQGIPEAELVQMAQWHQMAQTNPAQAADYLAQVSEQLRAQAQAQGNPAFNPPNPNSQSNPYPQLPPEVAQELQQVRAYMHQQTAEKIIQQIDGAFTGLAGEFGNQPIPENQRVHVLETVQQRNLGVEDIGMVWKALYGADYAKQQGIKQGQALRQAKAGLGAGSAAAPQPPSTPPASTDLWSDIDAICAAAGRK